MKNKPLLMLLGGLTACFCVSAQAEVTANIAASSNYYWRGITQTDDGAAVSGGLDYSNESGFYAGTWSLTSTLATPPVTKWICTRVTLAKSRA